MKKSVPIVCLLAGITAPFLSMSSTHQETIFLKSGKEHVSINTESLQIDWESKRSNISISESALLVKGVKQTSSKIVRDSTGAVSWLLSPSNIKVNASFDGELKLSFDVMPDVNIVRNKPLTLEWFDLPDEQAKTLLIPFNEGMRIPTSNKKWVSYMKDEYSGSNTTQDLKMPFWSVKAGDNKYVSYILLSPTNNNIDFSESNRKLDMQAQHQFTALNRNESFEVLISMGDDQLDAAKRYRLLREERGEAVPLSKKISEQPQLERLIGASHVYLFGKDALSEQDVKDWWGLKDWFFTKSGLAVKADAKKELAALKKGKDWLAKYHKRILVEAINEGLAKHIAVEKVAANDNDIKEQYEAAQKRKRWLAKSAKKYLINSSLWGQALSKDMIDNLSEAGLSKLWLGLDNWMPAFYQPQVVDQAKDAGYLVGTYDSYDTAIAKGVNDGWLTAQLPKSMREKCSIEQADGHKKKGFRGNGYYLNPVCDRDYVEQRIKDIVKYGRFNSLFLDVDATGMAREDYSKGDGMTESQTLNAFNDRMNWIANNQDIVLGSEDGNSTTTQGIAFAHGMETVGFGWTDNDMKHNRKSPYFLGAWYPDSKPAFFFKSAQVKQPYKDLFFSPQYSVPLYQTVFHDELINTHHWHTDSIKFTNVQMERDLISMLYNTPPMVHLSRDEVKSPNSPRVKILQHYQKGFMPIHKALWDKSLTDFKWLDEKGLLQQTTYSDGSIIVANFSDESKRISNNRTIKPHSIAAYLSDGTSVKWTSL